MNTLKILKEARIAYSMTTWQGTVILNDELLEYRYNEDDNGATLFVYHEEDGWTGWVESDLTNENHKILWAAIMSWGTPEELGNAGEEIDLDQEELEDFL